MPIRYEADANGLGNNGRRSLGHEELGARILSAARQDTMKTLPEAEGLEEIQNATRSTELGLTLVLDPSDHTRLWSQMDIALRYKKTLGLKIKKIKKREGEKIFEFNFPRGAFQVEDGGIVAVYGAGHIDGDEVQGWPRLLLDKEDVVFAMDKAGEAWRPELDPELKGENPPKTPNA